VKRKYKQYAVYKGEKLLVMGTAKECAEHLGIKPMTVYFYSSPAYMDRIADLNNTERKITVRIDD